MAVTVTLNQKKKVFKTTMSRTETEGDPSFQDPSALVLRRDGISPPGSSWLHPAPEGQNQKLTYKNNQKKKRKEKYQKSYLHLF